MPEGLLANIGKLDADKLLFEEMAFGIVRLTGCTLDEAAELVGMLRHHIVIPENPFTVH